MEFDFSSIERGTLTEEFSIPALRNGTRIYLNVDTCPKPAGEGMWEVRSISDPHLSYQVRIFSGSAEELEQRVPDVITCTCPHGKHAGGLARCKHAVAVLLARGWRADT